MIIHIIITIVIITSISISNHFEARDDSSSLQATQADCQRDRPGKESARGTSNFFTMLMRETMSKAFAWPRGTNMYRFYMIVYIKNGMHRLHDTAAGGGSWGGVRQV